MTKSADDRRKLALGSGVPHVLRGAMAALLLTNTQVNALPPIQGGMGGGTATSPAPIAPEKFALSPGGVDMRTGRYAYNNLDLSIGGPAEEGGIQLSRIIDSDLYDHGERFGTFGHNWDIFIDETRIPVQEANTPEHYDYLMAVHFGGRSNSFRDLWSRTSFNQVSNRNLADLTFVSNGTTSYRYTTNDGTIVKFRPSMADCGSRCSYAYEILQTNGVKFALEYDTGAGTYDHVRLRSVTSNRGYALLLEYSGTSTLVSKACVLNLAFTPKPTSNLCPAGVATTSYGYASNLMTSYTDAANATHTFGNTSTSRSFFKPGESTPYLTNTISGKLVSRQQFADGRLYSYTFNFADPDFGAGGSYVDNNNRSVSVRYGSYGIPNSSDPTELITPGPETITDELGRTTRYDYCVPHPTTGGCVVSLLQKRTDPEGNVQRFTYDWYNNPIETRRQAKTGSGLPDLVSTAAYSCEIDANCAKPIYTIDARASRTDYTYAAHGGVLTETGPAVNGVRPQKRYGYAQRHAWYKDATGTLVQSPSPIWVLTEEAQCRTGSVPGCIGTADEVKTVYEYGPTTGASNLLLRGRVVDPGGLSLRTCFTYDTQGNKIAETQPRAGLAVCS